MLLVAWLAGAVVLGAHVIMVSVRVARRFRGLPEVSDSEVLAVLQECRARMQVRTRFPLVESVDVRSPALHGVFRPRLLLPADFTRSFSLAELHFVFLHELAHLKRRDVLMNWVVAVLQVVHWFNPLLWLGFMRWRADRELACDALALETVGEGRNREYGRTILRLLESFTDRVATPGLVGILEDKRQLRQRIGMIASFVPARRWSLTAILLLVGLGVDCLTDAQAPRGKATKTSAAVDSSTGTTKDAAESHEARRRADPLPTANGTNGPAQYLTVIVIVAETGKPIADAEVFASIGDWRKAQPQQFTDAQGRCVVQVPVPPAELRGWMGNMNISVRHPDYASRGVVWTSSGGDVHAMLPNEVTLRLENGIPIGGVVCDEAGSPLSGVKVLLAGWAGTCAAICSAVSASRQCQRSGFHSPPVNALLTAASFSPFPAASICSKRIKSFTFAAKNAG
jgi:bla regulator protein BlaR1